MMVVLQEVESVILSPAVTWRKETLEEGATLYAGNRDGWQVQVVALGPAMMGTAVNTPKLTIIKLTDTLAQLALDTAKAALT